MRLDPQKKSVRRGKASQSIRARFAIEVFNQMIAMRPGLNAILDSEGFVNGDRYHLDIYLPGSQVGLLFCSGTYRWVAPLLQQGVIVNVESPPLERWGRDDVLRIAKSLLKTHDARSNSKKSKAVH